MREAAAAAAATVKLCRCDSSLEASSAGSLEAIWRGAQRLCMLLLLLSRATTTTVAVRARWPPTHPPRQGSDRAAMAQQSCDIRALISDGLVVMR